MSASLLIRHLNEKFPFEPTFKQSVFFQKMAEFLTSENSEVFLLKGFAGTGKTTLIQSLVNVLPHFQWNLVLLAPTGRAAKVLNQYTGKEASTIHRKIYYPKNVKGKMSFTLQKNKHKQTLFVVDESSMISSQNSNQFSGEDATLLEDLMEYVFLGNQCKLMFLGDGAQLPPVMQEISPALQSEFFRHTFHLNVEEIELDEVMRQAQNSGILMNATKLREILSEHYWENFAFQLNPFKDIIRLQDSQETLDAIHDAYQKHGPEETCFVVRSNKRANLYNQHIRVKIFQKESELSVGDLLMVVKNNYFWLKNTEEAGFIANGDIIEVIQIYKRMDLYDFKFAKVKVRMIDYPNMESFDTIVLLDTITSEQPSLSYDQSNLLYQKVLEDYAEERAMYKKIQKVKKNEYFNALQVKFSYAVTCHKAQGGQWESVFVEQPYLPNGLNAEDLRWLYTAITRAKSKLYLIGFEDQFFQENN